jgi:hypothetical protein
MATALGATAGYGNTRTAGSAVLGALKGLATTDRRQ